VIQHPAIIIVEYFLEFSLTVRRHKFCSRLSKQCKVNKYNKHIKYLSIKKADKKKRMQNFYIRFFYVSSVDYTLVIRQALDK